MLIRSLAFVLVLVSSFICAAGQSTAVKSEDADKSSKTKSIMPRRDIPFPAGVSLVFLIKELARDMDLNVLFDPESRLESRSVRIELKNVTAAEALRLILVQEKLVSEEVGPRTILVARRERATAVPKIGIGLTPLTVQLAAYFRVQGGVLVNTVRPDSPAAKAGLKAGDVIFGVDDVPVRGPLDLIRAIDDKKEGDVTLKIVRDRKDQTVSIRLDNISP
jgi:hypothetical protein